MFKKMIDKCLGLLCTSAGVILLFIVSISAGTMSSIGSYEYEMPTKLRPKDDD